MVLKILKLYLDFITKISLKTRLIFVLLINSLVTIALVGAVFFYNIYSVQENKVKNLIEADFNNIRVNIEDTLKNLGNISKQYAYENSIIVDGGIGSDLKKYTDYSDNKIAYSDKQILDILNIYSKMNRKIALINSANPILGLTLFYETGEEKKVMYSNDIITDNFINKQLLPEISSSEFITYNGIHKTLKANNYFVLSISRKMEIPEMNDSYVYMETNSQWYANLFKKNRYGMRTSFLMTDSQKKIIFSDNQGAFPVGNKLDMVEKSNGLMENGSYYLFGSKADSDWQIMVAIDKKDYDKEAIKLLQQFVLVGFISIGIAMIMTMLIWRTVYKPIRVFKREIRMLTDNMLEPKVRRTRVKEFDELLFDFYEAKLRIIQLLKQIEFKEKAQKELEIEKLLIQINPHFIHNTLNSIQWMARMNNQKEIERMISIFTRVLNYNLGKKSIIVTVEQEVNVLGDYIDLQKTRYQEMLSVDMKVDKTLLNIRIPRFITQPLVENAIFHGMKDDGLHIELEISTVDVATFRISVKDNGDGMTKEQIYQILNENKKWDKWTGLGIGLKYVDRMLKFYYGEDCKLCIESEKEKGTKIFMNLPVTLSERTTYD